MSGSILVVEDEPSIQELVSYVCASGGYAVRRAQSIGEARDLLAEQMSDLIILDWMLSDQSGIDLLKEVRGNERTREIPVIMLTARGAESDRVTGLDAGADDFIVKPFSPRELISRIKAILRRKAPQHSGEVIQYGPLKIDPHQHKVTVDGQAVKMGLSEFKLLKFLVSYPDHVFSRTQLLDSVWGDHVFIEERTVDVHVLRLRRALTDVGAADLVQTVRGLGYRFSLQGSSE